MKLAGDAVAPSPGRSSPRLTVITPARNAARWLPETAAALSKACTEAYEWIVIDDASDDGTAELAASLGATVLASDGSGPSIARNMGVMAARSEFLLFLDADDGYEAGGIDSLLAAADADPAADVYHCGVTLADADLVPMSRRAVCDLSREPFHGMIAANRIAPHAAIVRRTALARSGLFSPVFNFPCEDWEFWVRLAASGARFKSVEGEFAVYRDVPGSRSKAWRDMWRGAKKTVRTQRPAGHERCKTCLVMRRRGLRSNARYVYYLAVHKGRGKTRLEMLVAAMAVFAVCPIMVPLLVVDAVRALRRTPGRRRATSLKGNAKP